MPSCTQREKQSLINTATAGSCCSCKLHQALSRHHPRDAQEQEDAAHAYSPLPFETSPSGCSCSCMVATFFRGIILGMLKDCKSRKQLLLHAHQFPSEHHPHEQLAGRHTLLHASRQHDNGFQVLCQHFALHILPIYSEGDKAHFPLCCVLVKHSQIGWDCLHSPHRHDRGQMRSLVFFSSKNSLKHSRNCCVQRSLNTQKNWLSHVCKPQNYSNCTVLVRTEAHTKLPAHLLFLVATEYVLVEEHLSTQD